MRHAGLGDRLSGLLDSDVVRLSRIESRGYTTAYHAIAELDDGRTVFVKAGADEATSTFLREEITVYRTVQAPFMPAFHGADERDPPILVLGDLSGCFSTPPWTYSEIAAGFRAVAAHPDPFTPAEV